MIREVYSVQCIDTQGIRNLDVTLLVVLGTRSFFPFLLRQRLALHNQAHFPSNPGCTRTVHSQRSNNECWVILDDATILRVGRSSASPTTESVSLVHIGVIL